MSTQIFITGATGCIGHYVLDLLKDDPSLTLHLLLRDPKRLRFNPADYPNIHLHVGNLETIENHEAILKSVDYLIHIGTDWSNSDYAIKLNVEKTHQLFSYCHEGVCQRMVYFSTASILGKNNRPIPEAERFGTGYVKSKYLGYQHLQTAPYKDKVVTVFPTLVFGGDAQHPYSHISSGVVPNVHYLNLLRFIYMDARFHFSHAKDIAAVAKHVLLNPTPKHDYVLGNPVLTGKKAIEILCKTFGYRIWFRIKISLVFVLKLAQWFRIEVGPWDRFCLENPYFEYETVTPASFGLTTAFPTLESVLADLKA
ncbi:MAG: NAD-dependent epimerase/dehydratase family protein [Candidatus Margulisiibacteriota bacterium]